MAELRNKIYGSDSTAAKCSTAHVLAITSGLPIDQFVRFHSLLPLYRTLPQDDIDVLHGDANRPDLIDHFGSRLWLKTGVRFCSECIKEDIEYWGFAYWRRLHQLPGIHACYKHSVQLATSTLGRDAFDDVPRIDSANYYELNKSNFHIVQKNKVLQLYIEILHAFLELERPMDYWTIIDIIRVQFKKRQLSSSKKGANLTLTDYVLKHVPIAWLRLQYPFIDKRLTNEFFPAIDNIASRPVSAPSLALALATLFDSADEALNLCFSPLKGGELSLQSPSARSPEYWSGRSALILKTAVKRRIVAGQQCFRRPDTSNRQLQVFTHAVPDGSFP